MIARDLWRIAVAAGCAALGAQPDALALGVVFMLVRAWTASVAVWATCIRRRAGHDTFV